MWSNYEHSDFKAHQETPLEGNPALKNTKNTLMAQTLKAQEAIPKFKLFPKDCWHEPGFVFHLDWQVKVPPSRASLWHIPRLGFEQGLGTGMKEKLLLDKFRDEHSPLQKRNTDPCFSPKSEQFQGKPKDISWWPWLSPEGLDENQEYFWSAYKNMRIKSLSWVWQGLLSCPLTPEAGGNSRAAPLKPPENSRNWL